MLICVLFMLNHYSSRKLRKKTVLPWTVFDHRIPIYSNASTNSFNCASSSGPTISCAIAPS